MKFRNEPCTFVFCAALAQRFEVAGIVLSLGGALWTALGVILSRAEREEMLRMRDRQTYYGNEGP